MAAKGFSFAEKLSRWSVMATNLRADLPDLPFITDDLNELDKLVDEARALDSRNDAQRSLARETTSQMRDLARRADGLRARLGATLQGKHGFTSDTLVRYGLKPKKVPRRRAAAKPLPPPATAPTPAPVTPAVTAPAAATSATSPGSTGASPPVKP